MDEKSLFMKFWTNESRTTRNVLARILEGSDYRPDPKSRTAHQIAWQIVCEEKMIIEALESGKAEWAPAPMPATMKQVLKAYETQSAGMAVSCSTSFTTADRSPRTCGRWDRPCRRFTGRARTNRS